MSSSGANSDERDLFDDDEDTAKGIARLFAEVCACVCVRVLNIPPGGGVQCVVWMDFLWVEDRNKRLGKYNITRV